MLAWTVLELGEHPEVLAKLRAELDGGGEEAMAGKAPPPTYLECVMKESLRLHPPITFFSRALTRVGRVGGGPPPRDPPDHVAGRPSGSADGGAEGLMLTCVVLSVMTAARRWRWAGSCCPPATTWACP